MILSHHKQAHGFALIATISVMVLLVMIALAMLSLSTVELRASQNGRAMAEAQANARMALMIAIGELQKYAGADTRITASSSLLDESNVKVTGVWRSWEGTDRDASGKPLVPNYSLKNIAGDPGDPIAGDSDGRFLAWLASPFANRLPDVASLAGLSTSKTSGSVSLVSEGSVSEQTDEVYVIPTMLDGNGGGGAYAWWVSGENSKAMLNVDRVERPESIVEWQTRLKSNGRADAKTFGLDNIDKLPITSIVPSTGTLDFLSETGDVRRMHDLTTFNRGLLTNAATGGWKKDLSLLSENYASLPDRELPSLTIRPGEVRTHSKAILANGGNRYPNRLLYPWVNYSTAGTRAWQQMAAVSSWTGLIDHLTQYRKLTSSTSSKTAMPSSAASVAGHRYYFHDQVRRTPMIARMQWILSLCSREQADPSDPSKTHLACLLVTPVVTLWNPYNVEMSVNTYELRIDQIAPVSLSFKIGNQSYPETPLTTIIGGRRGKFSAKLKIQGGFTMAPGSTLTLGLNDNMPKFGVDAFNMELTQGYRPNGGYMFDRLNNGQRIYAKKSDQFSINEFAYHEREEGVNSQTGFFKGMSLYLDHFANGQYNAHRMHYRTVNFGSTWAQAVAVLNELYPPLTIPISESMEDVVMERNKPFASITLGFKPATPRPNNAEFANLHTKGLLTSNPLTYFSETTRTYSGTRPLMPGTGIYHPMNIPYDFSYQAVTGWNDTQSIPQFDPTTNGGYVVSGLTAGDGLARCVMVELPTRPIQSLAELQHFNARGNNPCPPFQFNSIGNGSAQPVFAPDQISIPSTYMNGFCNDESYMFNHLFFDDWFVSSIAPELNDFTKSEKRSMREVYQDHLSGATPLPNRFYLPNAWADTEFDVQSSAKDSNISMYAYETVASQLEVEGMINVNSVSLDAWKAWLRQGRAWSVPFIASNGSIQLDKATSYAFPRASIAGDVAAGSGISHSNPDFPEASEFAGYRTLTDTQIDALAEEIVKEIRKRGPFLSLSEFLNRRLTTDKELAAASAIQQALDTLSKSPSAAKNPYAAIQAAVPEITTQQPGPTDFKFPEAALGSSAFGVPGWIRQADILTRLAPMISVRDDTFTIRSYGDARDRNDSSKILARAWCEVVVCRRADYTDPTDAREINPHSAQMISEVNKHFGRRFEILSFRWLNPKEV